MKAGRLRHWVTFQTLATDQDSDGNVVQEWIDAFPVGTRMPCQIEPLSGREMAAAQSLYSRATAKITARFRPGFDAIQRAVNDDGTTYNIEAVLPDDESGRRYVILYCSAGTNAGGTAT